MQRASPLPIPGPASGLQCVMLLLEKWEPYFCHGMGKWKVNSSCTDMDKGRISSVGAYPPSFWDRHLLTIQSNYTCHRNEASVELREGSIWGIWYTIFTIVAMHFHLLCLGKKALIWLHFMFHSFSYAVRRPRKTSLHLLHDTNISL